MRVYLFMSSFSTFVLFLLFLLRFVCAGQTRGRLLLTHTFVQLSVCCLKMRKSTSGCRTKRVKEWQAEGRRGEAKTVLK